MDRIFDRWLSLGLAIVLALIAGNALLAYRNTKALHRSTAEVAHTHDVLAALDQVLVSATDAETGQRGFLITGDSAYLKPFEAAQARLGEEVLALDSLTRDEPGQQKRLQFLRQRIDEKLDELNKTIAVRRQQGFEAARGIVLTDHGFRAMEQLRGLVREMKDDAEQTRTARLNSALRNRDIALGTGLFAALVALFAVLILIRQLKRHLAARAEAATLLYDQKELFRTTLASIGDAVITTDAEGRVTFLNSVAAELTGWTTEDAGGRPLDQVFHIVNEATRQILENPAERALRDGVVVGLANHTVLIAKDGAEHPIDDSAAPIRGEKGVVYGVVLVFRDVTEAKEAARALREADTRKDEFLAVLAHELRNPLAPLQNSLGILRLSKDPPTLDQVRIMMERQLQQMVRLVDDLMDISRISRNALELRKEQVAVAVVVQNALEMSGPVLEKYDHTVTVDLPGQPLYVHADRTRLTQAVGNLLSNAAKYSDSEGKIRLTISQDGDAVVISVRDNGIGIPSEMLERVFEMFTQVDRSLERAHGGLGIGLSLVRRITELHGGTIEARSEGTGRGSEFIMRLPAVVTPQTAAPSPAHRLEPAPDRWRILVADDNRDAAESLAVMLRMMGHEVATAHDGEDAVNQAFRFKPQVALLDIGMPRLNGYDAARRIRAHPDGEKVLLLALTGWSQEADRQRTAEAGFVRHLVKPLDPLELTKLLAEWATDGR